ncbi:hypothetical protein [Pseudodesulfovibrio sp.]|uniref:hypothetical protein n=1 Tax=unclassified Pseudodesulfovibrio TaxID=2661612 RepID=UPI003B006757
MSNQALADLIAFLDKAAATVRRVEAEGEAALKSEGQAAYVEKMREKANYLLGLAEQGRVLTEAIGGEEGKAIHARLRKFSASAKASLGFDSVFFMSALLYPEDYKPGDPNDLELFVQSLREKV